MVRSHFLATKQFLIIPFRFAPKCSTYSLSLRLGVSSEVPIFSTNLCIFATIGKSKLYIRLIILKSGQTSLYIINVLQIEPF